METLKPRAIFGINGKVRFGLHLHPDKKHILFPLGQKIVIANTETNHHLFITGHTNNVSCLDVSRNGKMFASGQINHMGFRAFVILWDYEKRREIARHDLHKVRVESISFSANDRYVVSIGGIDDGTVIVFDVETHSPICRSVASKSTSGQPLKVCCLQNNQNFFVVAGERHLRMWSVERERKKLNCQDIGIGKYQRTFLSGCIDRCDDHIYLGSTTGDIIKVLLSCCHTQNVTRPGSVAGMIGAYGTHNPRKPYGKDCERYVNGVRDIHILDDGVLFVGTGDGTLEIVEERREAPDISFKNYPGPTWPRLRTLRKTKVNGGITSMVEVNPNEYYVCTERNEIYLIFVDSFIVKLLKTSHLETVYAITFPKKSANVFATAGHENIRVWSIKRLQELLRIMVWNFYCAGIEFAHDGTNIVSAWNDGIIRTFTPITGKLIYAIPNAHNKGCSAITISSSGRMIVSGGVEGQVRVWKIEPFRQSLIGVLKDHSGAISSLHFNHLDTECISACVDGSCVIWDVNRMTRKQVFTANTQFLCGRFYPGSVQVLTCGADGRVNYWIVYNGSLIRELTCSNKSPVNCVDISKNGDYFVTAGSDQSVKLFDYKRGTLLAQSEDHCSSVISCAYSPDGSFFVSGAADGSVIVWNVPQAYRGKSEVPKIEDLVADKNKGYGNIDPKYRTGGAGPCPKRENVDDIVAAIKKGDVSCVECPPVDMRKKVDINEQCNIKTDVTKC